MKRYYDGWSGLASFSLRVEMRRMTYNNVQPVRLVMKRYTEAMPTPMLNAFRGSGKNTTASAPPASIRAARSASPIFCRMIRVYASAARPKESQGSNRMPS